MSRKKNKRKVRELDEDLLEWMLSIDFLKCDSVIR